MFLQFSALIMLNSTSPQNKFLRVKKYFPFARKKNITPPLKVKRIKFLHFVPFRQQIWPPRAILVSDWLMLKKFSPLKLLGQMEPNLAGSIYVRSSIKLLHLIPFGQQTWPLLLKIEHRIKLHIFGNNSKTLIISEI